MNAAVEEWRMKNGHRWSGFRRSGFVRYAPFDLRKALSSRAMVWTA
jgi:hypothetical protein